jgi:hypothetical protein
MFFFCLIHPEDGDLNVRRNIRIIWTYNVAKSWKLKLHIMTQGLFFMSGQIVIAYEQGNWIVEDVKSTLMLVKNESELQIVSCMYVCM